MRKGKVRKGKLGTEAHGCIMLRGRGITETSMKKQGGGIISIIGENPEVPRCIQSAQVADG
jgi:hypothetical protein